MGEEFPLSMAEIILWGEIVLVKNGKGERERKTDFYRKSIFLERKKIVRYSHNYLLMKQININTAANNRKTEIWQNISANVSLASWALVRGEGDVKK